MSADDLNPYAVKREDTVIPAKVSALKSIFFGPTARTKGTKP